MAAGAKGRDDRVARERARVYQARQEFHLGQARRRVRDNVIAAVGGGVLLLAIIGGQTLYFTAGPGVPEPTPSQTEPAPAPPTIEPTTPTPEPTTTP